MIFVCGYLSNTSTYAYDQSSVESAKMNEYMTSKREISKNFDLDNLMAIVVPAGDYDSEAAILSGEFRRSIMWHLLQVLPMLL